MSSKNLIASIQADIGRYVLISSVDVYKNFGLFLGVENGKPLLDSIAETDKLRNSRFPYREEPILKSDDLDKKWRDSYDKIPIEHAVQNISCEWTILRLPMVYGPGDPQRRFKWVVEPMLKKQNRIIVPKEFMDWVATYGFIDNIGNLIGKASTDESTHNGKFNVSDEIPRSHREWVYDFKNVFGWEGYIEESNNNDVAGFEWLSSLDLAVPLKFSGSALMSALNTEADIGMETRLQRTLDWEIQQLEQNQ